MNKRNLFWGILLIVVGILFLGRNMDWWDFSIFFDGWWTLFIIVPCFIGLFNEKEKTGIKGTTFCHSGRFLMTCKTKEAAYQVLEKILREAKKQEEL